MFAYFLEEMVGSVFVLNPVGLTHMIKSLDTTKPQLVTLLNDEKLKIEN